MTPDREALFELARKAEKTWSYNQLIALVRSLAQELETADNARDHFVRRSIALREIIADLPCLSEPPCRFFFRLSFGRHRSTGFWRLCSCCEARAMARGYCVIEL